MEADDLLHEALLRLVARNGATPLFADRCHFEAVVVLTMRHVLTDQGRAANALKRRNEVRGVWLEPESPPFIGGGYDIIELSLGRAKFCARQAKVVYLRVLDSASIEEIARELCVSPRTVKRDWAAACESLRVTLRPLKLSQVVLKNRQVRTPRGSFPPRHGHGR